MYKGVVNVVNNQIPLENVLPKTVIDFITLMQDEEDCQIKKAYSVIVDDYLNASIECHANNMFNIVECQKRDAYVGFFDDTQVKDYLEQADILSWLSCLKQYVEKIMNEKEI